MSFEGYHQALCPDRHLFSVPYDNAGDMPIEVWNCPVCGKMAIWDNLVDETNCESSGLVKLEIDIPKIDWIRGGRKLRSYPIYKWPPLNVGRWEGNFVLQMICQNDHYYEVMEADPHEKGNCPICGARYGFQIKWRNRYDPEVGGRGGRIAIKELDGVGPIKLRRDQLPSREEGVWLVEV